MLSSKHIQMHLVNSSRVTFSLPVSSLDECSFHKFSIIWVSLLPAWVCYDFESFCESSYFLWIFEHCKFSHSCISVCCFFRISILILSLTPDIFPMQPAWRSLRGLISDFSQTNSFQLKAGSLIRLHLLMNAPRNTNQIETPSVGSFDYYFSTSFRFDICCVAYIFCSKIVLRVDIRSSESMHF